MFSLFCSVLLGGSVFIMLVNPNPRTIACTVVVGAIFLINLVNGW